MAPVKINVNPTLDAASVPGFCRYIIPWH